MPKQATQMILSDQEQEALVQLTKRHRSEQQHVLRREFEYIRHGTLSWFISFDVVTGQVLETSWGPTRTEEDALAHIQRLIASDRKATRWHLMLDNLNIHQSESLVCWVAEREGIVPEALGVKGKRGILQSMESRAAFLHDPTQEASVLLHAQARLLDESGGNLAQYPGPQAAPTGQFPLSGRLA